MNNVILEDLNTFGKGYWLYFPCKIKSPEFFIQNCKIIKELSKGTELCLKNDGFIEKYLYDADFFAFVDNDNKLQIIGDVYNFKLESIRGVDDGIEQNINENYLDVVNEFFNKNYRLIDVDLWKEQTNWIYRLKQYNSLFNNKKYLEIDVEQLINDLAFNGYIIHHKNILNNRLNYDKIYYPKIKSEIFKQPRLKPMIANYLNCNTYELFIGKYNGNGENIKYIVGDLISKYLSKDCNIKNVFGSIEIKEYNGEIDPFFISASLNTHISYSKENKHKFDTDKFLSECIIQK